MLRRGREAGVHVGGVRSGRSGDGEVRGIRAIEWNTGVGVAWGDEGRVEGGAGRGAIGVLGEVGALELGGRMEGGVDFYALAGADVVEVGEGEAGETAFEEGLAEGDLALDELGVATEGEGLSVPVLLLAGNGRGRTGGTLWVLGVALAEK